MNFFWKLGLESPLWSAGQFIVAHYRGQLPPPPAPPDVDPFADDRKLRVIIAARPKRAPARLFVNQEQVWSWCTKFSAPTNTKNWHGTSCVLHEFGR